MKKRHASIILAGGLVCSTLLLGSISLTSRLAAAPVAWQDNANGYAIGGFDPVAYFTDQKPRTGHNGIEHRWGSRVWNFASTGNRDAFAKHPHAYTPKFAGYDAEALSRGLAVEGSPVVWAIYRGRVFLFQSSASLAKWRANSEQIIELAMQNWENVSRNLTGTSRY